MSNNANTKPQTDSEKEETQVEEKTDIKRFLTFESDNLIFGVNTDQVVEIINNHSIRSIPMVPPYVRGVINLRGQIIPIIDFRLKMDKPFKDYTARTCIVILNINSNTIGIIVDAVSQVLDIDLEKSSPIPVEKKMKMTNSMVSIDEKTVVLLLECEELLKL